MDNISANTRQNRSKRQRDLEGKTLNALQNASGSRNLRGNLKKPRSVRHGMNASVRNA